MDRTWGRLRALGGGMDEAAAVTERRFAVAIHEAGHAVVFAFFRVDVPYIQMGLDPDPSGHTRGLDGPIADYIEFLAPLHAGNVAVEELCGGYRLPVACSPPTAEGTTASGAAETKSTHYPRAHA